MDQRVKKALGLMADDLQGMLSLDKLSQLVNLSPSRLRHLLKAETGRTRAQHLTLFRMQKAKELLEYSFLSIKEIMTEVGMCNESHFVHDFKRICGQTPTQYRRATHIAPSPVRVRYSTGAENSSVK
jgi:AraC family transcriptional regulator of arabinose operon